MMTLVHTGREPHTGTVAGKPLHVMAALSADMVFMRSLSSVGFGGRVHSVFKRVINIELSGGGLFTLASCDLDNAPDTIIVDSADFSEIHVAARQRVSTVGNLMHVGPFWTYDSEMSRAGAASYRGILPTLRCSDAISTH
jgi:hypothetical protein